MIISNFRTFGRFIKGFRCLLQMNQEEFGKALGVSRNTVSSWELDCFAPSANCFVQILTWYWSLYNFDPEEIKALLSDLGFFDAPFPESVSVALLDKGDVTDIVT